MNLALLKLVDDLIVDYHHRTRAGKPMWSLNYLVYAGSKTVVATVNDYVRQLSSATKKISGLVDNCSRKIKEASTSIKRLRAELGQRKTGAHMSRRQRKKSGAGWVTRKYGKISSSKMNGLIVQLTDVVRIKAN